MNQNKWNRERERNRERNRERKEKREKERVWHRREDLSPKAVRR